MIIECGFDRNLCYFLKGGSFGDYKVVVSAELFGIIKRSWCLGERIG